ncbi:hypothetical protein ACIRP2_28150 [Streptomyces sp. NPDC101194]|uniref:hypothetical protein n=1 Tax=Streptomyces sp. NPDC101194 TaxID=3366127 RepID=UPI00380DBFAC
MPTTVVVEYREGLDQALRCRGLEPFYITPAPLHLQDRKDNRCVADMDNAQEVLRTALPAGLRDLAGVISVRDFGVLTAAHVHRQLNLPGNSESQRVLLFRDKYLQKSRIPPDVRRARARHVSGARPTRNSPRNWGHRSSSNGPSARARCAPRSSAPAEEHHRALKPLPGGSDVDAVAKSFVDAPEIYMDGIRQDGGMHWRSLTRCHGSPLSTVHGPVLAAPTVASTRRSSSKARTSGG